MSYDSNTIKIIVHGRDLKRLMMKRGETNDSSYITLHYISRPVEALRSAGANFFCRWDFGKPDRRGDRDHNAIHRAHLYEKRMRVFCRSVPPLYYRPHRIASIYHYVTMKIYISIHALCFEA